MRGSHTRVKERDIGMLMCIHARIAAIEHEEDARFGSVRIPMVEFTREQMDRLVDALEKRAIDVCVQYPNSSTFTYLVWQDGSTDDERKRLLWMDDEFKESPLGTWMAHYVSTVNRACATANPHAVWAYASKWLRREIRSLFESIIAIWNAEHVVFELSLVEDRPYALRLTKKAIY